MASAVADCGQSHPNNNDVTPHSVIFQDFSEGVPVQDHTLTFIFQTLSQRVPQYGDWIGLFRVGRINPELSDYVSYIGVKDGSISLGNNNHKASLLLSNSEELDVNTSYQLIYVTTGCSIVGCSQSFWFRDGLCIVEDAPSSSASTLGCKCCQHNNKSQDLCSNESLDNSCNISLNSSSENLQALQVNDRDFAAHGRQAFQNLSDWLSFMSNTSRQKMKMHKASVKTVDELWHTDPKTIANRSKNYERHDYIMASDYTNTGINTSKIKFSMGDKNSLNVAESKELTNAEIGKENEVAQTLLFGVEDCIDTINPTPKSKLRKLLSEDYYRKPLTMIEDSSSKVQTIRKSNSAELVLSGKMKPQSSNSSVDIFSEAVHADDALNTLYLKLAESERKLRSLTDELRMSTLTVESQKSEIKQCKTIMNLQAGEIKKHSGTIQSQSLMLLQYREKMEVQQDELKNLREKTESSIHKLKAEKEKNKLLNKELEEVNGRIKLQSTELDMRCNELHSFKALANKLSKELNEVKEQEVARSSEMFLLKEKLEAQSSNLKLLKDRDILNSAELQHLRTEVELKSAELTLIRDSDKSRSDETKLLQDQLHTRFKEISSLKETVQLRSMELTQLRSTMASLTMQADAERTALAARLSELEAMETEIKQRKEKEEEQCRVIGQHQTTMESLLTEVRLRDTKEKKLQDELKELSDTFQLCRAQKMQLEEDLDKCKAKEEMSLIELTQLRSENELVSDEMDQLKAINVFLVSELHQSKSSNELLLEEFRMLKMSQEQTSSAYFRARINMELLSKLLEKLRLKEECSSEKLKDSDERLEAISHELMLSRDREENLLEELAQIKASDKPLMSELPKCRTRDEELQQISQQGKVINSTLSSGCSQSLVNGTLISRETDQVAESSELEEGKPNATELCSLLQQSQLQVETLADDFQQSMESLKLVSEELKMTEENRKSLAAELESSKFTELQDDLNQPEANRSGLAADQETRLLLLSNEVKQMQVSKDALIIESGKNKASETRLHSSLIEFEVKQDTRFKVKGEMFAADLKEGKTNEDVLMAELKQSKSNEERLSSQLIESRRRLENLSSDLVKMRADDFKDYKEREAEHTLSELHQYQTDQESLPTEFRQHDNCGASFPNELDNYKLKQEMPPTRPKECKVKEEIVPVELKKGTENEEIALGELKECNGKECILYKELTQYRINEDKLASGLDKSKVKENIISAELQNNEINKHELTKFKSSAERLSLERKQRKVSEPQLSGEINQLQSYSSYDLPRPLIEKHQSATSQGLVEEMRADSFQLKKRGCQAFEEMSPSTKVQEVSVSSKSQAHPKLSHWVIMEQLQKKVAEQSEEILQYREQIQSLLYKNLVSVKQKLSICEDIAETGIEAEETMAAQSEKPKKGNQRVEILFKQLRTEQEFRENLFALHELKNKELFKQIAVLNNLVIASEHQLENISQIWIEPATHTDTDDTNKLVQENVLGEDVVDQCSLPYMLYKFRSGSSDEAFIQTDHHHGKDNRNSDSRTKGHNDAEARMAGKLDNQQTRSADFHTCAIRSRKKKTHATAFRSRVTRNLEASVKNTDFSQNCDVKQGPSLKKLDAQSYDNGDDKKNHFSKSLALKSGAEINQASISADDELVPSVDVPESYGARRKGPKRLSVSASPKTMIRKVSILKGKSLTYGKLRHSDKSKVHSPDLTSSFTTAQLSQQECSQLCLDSPISRKSAHHNCYKTDKLKADVPSKETSKNLQSLLRINMTTDTTVYNHFVGKVPNSQGPQIKCLNAQCCSLVKQPNKSAAQTACGLRKRSYTTLKKVTDNMSNYLDSVAEVYPEKISLDVVNYFSADNQARDLAFSSQLQESKNNIGRKDADHLQRSKTLSDSFPISSEMFSVITSQFVEKLTDRHLELPDKCNVGMGPKCESRASSKQLKVCKLPKGHRVESAGNLHIGRGASMACGSNQENNTSDMSSSASLFSESVETPTEASTRKSQKGKYPVQDSSKASSKPSPVSRQNSDPAGQKIPWRSSSQYQSLRPVSYTTNGRRDGLGYARSLSLQKKLGVMKSDRSRAEHGYKCKNPNHTAPKPFKTGNSGYAAKAEQVGWNADKKIRFCESPRSIFY